MSRKAFIVKVDLDVQAVTCPGVWLCSTGQVSLQLYMLDSCVQTSSFRPAFPMLFHEQFVFNKILPTKFYLEDLNKQLSREWLYVELIQWETCTSGNVLAYFQIPLNELLYPRARGGVSTGAEVDLLMEPTPAFPGALAPKLEVSTKTTIDETICSCPTKPGAPVVNPKLMTSTGAAKVHNKPVCHGPDCLKTIKFRMCHRKCGMYFSPPEKPPFRYRKVEDNLLGRTPVMSLNVPLQYPLGMQSHAPSRAVQIRKILKESMRRQLINPMQCQKGDRVCSCGKGHTVNTCTVCTKYSGVFNHPRADNKQIFFSTTPNETFLENLKHQQKKQIENNMMAPIQEVPNDENGFDEVSSRPRGRCQAHAGGTCRAYVYEKNPTNKNATIATKLHDRITRTLHSIPKYLNEVTESCKDAKDAEYLEDYCTCEQMPNMKHFYKQLFNEQPEEVR